MVTVNEMDRMDCPYRHNGAVEKVRCWLIPLLWRGGRRSLTGWFFAYPPSSHKPFAIADMQVRLYGINRRLFFLQYNTEPIHMRARSVGKPVCPIRASASAGGAGPGI